MVNQMDKQETLERLKTLLGGKAFFGDSGNVYLYPSFDITRELLDILITLSNFYSIDFDQYQEDANILLTPKE